MKNTRKTKNIKSDNREPKCPMCGEIAHGWVYMLHFTLGCETAKRY